MHNFKKKYGQNFLRDDTILNEIVNNFEVLNNSVIIEVGPGDGALTNKLLLKKTPVISFEIDKSLKCYLDKINDNNLTVIYDDFLKVTLKEYTEGKNVYVIANVPYYITTPIITKFIDEEIIPEIMILMVQKEVALRLCSKPGNKDYGAITVILRHYFDIEYILGVDRDKFYPVPNVDSAIIKLTKKNKYLELKDFNRFKLIVNKAFSQKRKNLKNNFKGYDLEKIESILNRYNKNLNNRAEELDYEIFVDIANNI